VLLADELVGGARTHAVGERAGAVAFGFAGWEALEEAHG
jgi:hypothetical protein